MNGCPVKQSSIQIQHQSHDKDFKQERNVLGVIAPHAGYDYSGAIAGRVYGAIGSDWQECGVQTIVVLGPSHHAQTSRAIGNGKIGISMAEYLETPLGNLRVDTANRQWLLQTAGKHFVPLEEEADEQEHSLEMHYAFLKALFPVDIPANQKSSKNLNSGAKHIHGSVQVLPMLYAGGAGTAEGARIPTALLDALWQLSRRCILRFVISSDFCHWGANYDYYGGITTTSGHSSQQEDILESVARQDQQAIRAICKLDAEAFTEHLQSTGNTICGRGPIALYLALLKRMAEHGLSQEEQYDYHGDDDSDSVGDGEESIKGKLLTYGQSSKRVSSKKDSFVCYAGIAFIRTS